MTWEQYWLAPAWYADFFLEADQERQKRRNEEFWLQGLYICDAFSAVLNNAFAKKGDELQHYPEQPYSFTRKEPEEVEKKQSPEEQERLKARLYMKQMEWASKGWGKEIPSAQI